MLLKVRYNSHPVAPAVPHSSPHQSVMGVSGGAGFHGQHCALGLFPAACSLFCAVRSMRCYPTPSTAAPAPSADAAAGAAGALSMTVVPSPKYTSAMLLYVSPPLHVQPHAPANPTFAFPPTSTRNVQTSLALSSWACLKNAAPTSLRSSVFTMSALLDVRRMRGG
jgi:hypothetical protein